MVRRAPGAPVINTAVILALLSVRGGRAFTASHARSCSNARGACTSAAAFASSPRGCGPVLQQQWGDNKHNSNSNANSYLHHRYRYRHHQPSPILPPPVMRRNYVPGLPLGAADCSRGMTKPANMSRKGAKPGWPSKINGYRVWASGSRRIVSSFPKRREA